MRSFPSAELLDARTKIPLPFAPRPDLPEIRKNTNLRGNPVADFHHAAEGEQQLLQGGVSTRALRFARRQWVTYDDHHNGYHHNRMKALPPATRGELFTYIVMASALHLPDRAINFRTCKRALRPEIVPLTPRDRGLMWERRDIQIHDELAVNQYLAREVVASGIPLLRNTFDARIREQFRKDPAAHAEPLLRRLAELAVVAHDTKTVYAAAMSAGELPPGAPINAKSLLVGRLVPHMASIEEGVLYRNAISPLAMMLDGIAAQPDQR